MLFPAQSSWQSIIIRLSSQFSGLFFRIRTVIHPSLGYKPGVIGEWHPSLTCRMQHLFESKDKHTHTHIHSDPAPHYTLPNVVREWWGTVLPTEKSCLFHLRQITISPGLDSSGLSLWNGIPAHALQIYLLFYLPGQAHGKIIPNTCRALSGTLE